VLWVAETRSKQLSVELTDFLSAFSIISQNTSSSMLRVLKRLILTTQRANLAKEETKKS
jgi:hypothetical protein